MSTLSSEPSELARAYLDHALAGRGAEAVQTLTDALLSEAIGRRPVRARHRAGCAPCRRPWQQARISVADEHFVTQLNQKLIAIAGTLRPVPQSNAEHVVLACPPDEQHDTGLRMMAELLNAHGYRASMLGAATPIGDLVGYVGESRPVAVGLSIASPLAIGSLAATIGALQEAEPALPIFVGGWCIERYPGVSAAVGVQSCVTTRDTLAFLDELRGRK